MFVDEIAIETPWDAMWRPQYVGTLTFIITAGQVLLIEKKTGHGAGKVNAPGGKLEPGEGPLQCAVREVREEVGLSPLLTPCAIELRFVERDGPQWLGFAYLAFAYTGTLIETAEARPFWCAIEEIPYARMWPDDAIWLPEVLDRKPGSSPLVANFLFEGGRLLAHEFVVQTSICTTLRARPTS